MTFENSLKAGDLVMLKSGGPRMVVTGVHFGRVFCQWFDKEQHHHHFAFEEGILQPAEMSASEWLEKTRVRMEIGAKNDLSCL